MPSAGHLTRFFLDGIDLSTDGFSLGVSIDIPQEDATTFQAAASTFVAMTPDGSIDMSGYYSGGSPYSLEQKIQSSLALPATAAALFGTAVAACPAYILPAANGDNMKISAGQKLLTMNGKWSAGAGGIKRGLRVYQGSVAATGVQAGIDLGSAGSNGGAAYLFLYAVSGTATNAQVKLQSDSVSNFATAADEGTFTVSARGGYAVNLSGVIGRYVRANVVSLGGATNLSFALIACVNGVTM